MKAEAFLRQFSSCLSFAAAAWLQGYLQWETSAEVVGANYSGPVPAIPSHTAEALMSEVQYVCVHCVCALCGHAVVIFVWPPSHGSHLAPCNSLSLHQCTGELLGAEVRHLQLPAGSAESPVHLTGGQSVQTV